MLFLLLLRRKLNSRNHQLLTMYELFQCINSRSWPIKECIHTCYHSELEFKVGQARILCAQNIQFIEVKTQSIVSFRLLNKHHQTNYYEQINLKIEQKRNEPVNVQPRQQLRDGLCDDMCDVVSRPWQRGYMVVTRDF